MKQKLKEWLIPVYQWIQVHLFAKSVPTKKNLEEERAYLFLCPDYGNIGDIAISFAQIELLKQTYLKENIIPIYVKDTYRYAKSIRKQMSSRDMIYFIGGGNFGGLYPAADYGRLFLLSYFKKFSMVSFPQTITFTTNHRFVSRYQKKFRQCTSFYLFLREEKSYQLAQECFLDTGINIELVPDIVFSLKEKIEPNIKREQFIVLSLRQDKESLLTLEKRNQIKDIVSQLNFSYQEIDTIVVEFQKEEKENYLRQLLNHYSRSKFVITDRLHGMIFSYITRTPCIVFANNNGKIKNTYQLWLKKCRYIHFVEDIKEISTTIKKIEKLVVRDYDYSVFSKYQKLLDVIQKNYDKE